MWSKDWFTFFIMTRDCACFCVFVGMCMYKIELYFPCNEQDKWGSWLSRLNGFVSGVKQPLTWYLCLRDSYAFIPPLPRLSWAGVWKDKVDLTDFGIWCMVFRTGDGVRHGGIHQAALLMGHLMHWVCITKPVCWGDEDVEFPSEKLHPTVPDNWFKMGESLWICFLAKFLIKTESNM